MQANKRLLERCFWGARDQEQFLAEIVTLIDAQLPSQNIFAGDNMVVFGRNQHFMDDAAFMESFSSVISADNYVGRAIMWRIHVYCWAAKQGLRRQGDFVECGVASGALSAIACAYLGFGSAAKRFHLIDAWDTDARVDASVYQGNSLAYARSVFSKYQNVRLVPGFIPDVFETAVMPERIAFLHLDLNSAAAEIAALEFLFDRMTPGAVLLLDDFGHSGFRETQIAQIEWFNRRGLSVVELPTGQGMVVA